MKRELTLDAAIITFGESVRKKLTSVGAQGESEEQLRTPLDILIREIVELLGLPRESVDVIGIVTARHSCGGGLSSQTPEVISCQSPEADAVRLACGCRLAGQRQVVGLVYPQAQRAAWFGAEWLSPSGFPRPRTPIAFWLNDLRKKMKRTWRCPVRKWS